MASTQSGSVSTSIVWMRPSYRERAGLSRVDLCRVRC